ncbi:MAG: CBS domain-containing protein, partial [Phaeodactylibacter sp.]|nr:CBS domain-containing protein [Phaeodactylibacter sp.]
MAAGFLRENLIHDVPVVDKGELVGIITTFDLITYA